VAWLNARRRHMLMRRRAATMRRDARAGHPAQQTRAATSATQQTSGSSLGLVLVVALLGAIAGGSLVEAIAAFASRPGAPISPGHLVAAPLALAGAICGAFLAGILARNERHHSPPRLATEADSATIVTDMAAESVLWEPVPPVISMPSRPLAQPQPPETPTAHVMRTRHLAHQRAHPHQKRRAAAASIHTSGDETQ
jgi:hypothetical protein